MHPFPVGNLQGQYPQGGNTPPVPSEQPSLKNDDDIYMPEKSPCPRHHVYPPDDFENWHQRNNMEIQHPPTIPEAPQTSTGQPPLQGVESPWRSGRIRQPVNCPDNVYGNWNPTDILQQSDNVPPSSEDCQPSSLMRRLWSQAVRPDALEDQEFSKIVQEGGT